jgi:hypothetical protein
MENFDILVPFVDESLIFDGNVDFHLSGLVEDLSLFELFPKFREGQLNQKVPGNALNLIGDLSRCTWTHSLSSLDELLFLFYY